MKINYVLFLATIIVSLAEGHRFPRRGVRGIGIGPHVHRRAQENLVEKSKKDNPDGRIDGCDTTHPFPTLETGCPCFSLETITSQAMDYSQASDCEFFEELVEEDVLWEIMAFYAYSLEEVIEGEQSISTYLSFHVEKYEGGQSCYASVDTSKYYDAESNLIEQHSYGNPVELTDEEFTECSNVLNTFKYQLPENCNIMEGFY